MSSQSFYEAMQRSEWEAEHKEETEKVRSAAAVQWDNSAFPRMIADALVTWMPVTMSREDGIREEAFEVVVLHYSCFKVALERNYRDSGQQWITVHVGSQEDQKGIVHSSIFIGLCLEPGTKGNLTAEFRARNSGCHEMNFTVMIEESYNHPLVEILRRKSFDTKLSPTRC